MQYTIAVIKYTNNNIRTEVALSQPEALLAEREKGLKKGRIVFYA